VWAWEIAGGFGLEQLRRVEREAPTPGPGQVRLRLRAVSLNYRDLMMIRGEYNPRQRLPLVPGSDGAGQIDAVGEGVVGLKVGDRVSPAFAQAWLSGRPARAMMVSTLGGPLDGVLQEALVVPAASVVSLPDALSDEEAACVPCAAVTAWRALVVRGALRAGDTVLTLGTGGVSLFALQIARLHGARVAIVSSSHEKLARARAMGAELALSYRDTPEWGRAVAEWSGEGVDQVMELGGAGTLDQSLRAVRVGGQINLIGVLSGAKTELALTRVFMNGVRVEGIFVGSREDHVDVLRALVAGGARPTIDQVFGFAELPQALERLASGGHFGKVVVRVDA